MSFKSLCIAALLGTALFASTTSNAGVVFNEPWTGATAGTITVPGGSVTTALRTWTSSSPTSGTPPTIAVSNISGDLKFENTATGSGSSNEAVLTTSGLTGFVAGKVTTIEFDVRDATPATTSQQRMYVLVENATSRDGYRVRLSSQTTSEQVLNATVYDDGVDVADMKIDDNVNGPGVNGIPNASGEWHVNISFIPDGTNTKIRYEVTGIGATPNLVANNTQVVTLTPPALSAGVQDPFDQVSVWFRRPLAAIDNVVISQDTEAPTITLTGSASLTLECGAAYNDAGATASDSFDGDLTSALVVNNPVDTAIPGTYTVTYNVSDASANAATQVTRSVTVEDTTDPVVTLTGADPIVLSCGNAFNDPGASALDGCDGTLAPVASGTVNTVQPGDYTITYTATDGEGNTDSETRTVTVLNDCPPILITPTTPTSANVLEGVSVNFGISASGSGLITYQWYFDDGSNPPTLLINETSPNLSISPAVPSDSGTYYCLVSDDSNSDVQSPSFSLVVQLPVPVASLSGLLVTALAAASLGARALRRR